MSLRKQLWWWAAAAGILFSGAAAGQSDDGERISIRPSSRPPRAATNPAATPPRKAVLSLQGNSDERRRSSSAAAAEITPASRLPESECLALAKDIERDAKEGNGGVFDRSIDRATLARLITADVNAPAEEAQAYANDFVSSFRPGDEVRRLLRGKGSFHFLRLKTDDGQRRALMRLVAGNFVNYYELLLTRGPGERVMVADVLVYSLGQPASEFARDMFRLSRELPEPRKAMRDADAVLRLAGDGAGNQALLACAKLPSELREQRAIVIARCTAAAQVSPEEQRKALAEYRGLFSMDGMVELSSLNAYLKWKQFDDFDAAMYRLERLVGEDACLQCFRAGAAAARGELTAARQRADDAVRMEDGLQLAHETVLAVALRQKDYPAVAKELLALETRFAVRFNNLEKQRDFHGFVRSAAYAQWKRDRDKAVAGAGN